MKLASNVIFVGGPGSGKSNYLFRTWIAIERSTGRLVKNGLPLELDYLHEGSSILLEGKFAPHTSKETRRVCEIPIADRSHPGTTSMLIVPDASGELWLDLYRLREWQIQWDNLLTENCGFMLFVRVDSPHNVAAMDWISSEKLYSSTISSKPTDVPTQVLLVEWLQILRWVAKRNLGSNHVPRLSIVVTAWDRLPSDQRDSTPQDYLETEFPLLAQFISSGTDGLAARVFGVSIVGGDLEHDSGFREKFLQSDPPTLGYTVFQTKTGLVERRSDVLIPIYWALGLDE